MPRIGQTIRSLALLLVLTASSAHAMDRLDALWMIETGGNDWTVGRAGEISRYQVRQSLWRTITASRDYSSPQTARMVASRLMDMRIKEFDAIRHRQPSNFEYYALWNAPNQILSGHVSSAVAERCQRFCNLCSRKTMDLTQASR